MKGDGPSPPADGPPAACELAALVQQARAGDPTVLPRLRELLDRHPEVWERIGDLGRSVESVWLDVLSGGNVVVRESIRRHVDQMRRDLAGPHPTRAEAMLVEQVVATWLEVQLCQCNLADQTGTGSIPQATYRLRRGEVAQRKFLAAMKTLATLRAVVPEGLAPLNGVRVHDPPDRERA
jgi:hypothetical protein